ncbi:MAG: hypothetical protein RI980_1126 [Bacteroidota bacterium]|jgi:hypothetical protein
MRTIIILVLFGFNVCNGQDKIDLNYLYKEWKLVTLEKNGMIKTAEEFDKKESIIFYKNNKFKMKDSEHILNGIWKFNYLTSEMELNIIELNQKISLKIISLQLDVLDYIYKELDDKMVFHLKPKIN